MACRYAVYFAPRPQTALAAFGAAALGYDAQSGTAVAFHDGLETGPVDWQALVAEPSRYGFHATLKAPFELREGADEAALLATADEVARRTGACVLGRLRVAPLTRFIALMPSEMPACVSRLERDIVEGFEPLRAPLSASDRTRRLQTPLSDRQIRYLDAWGYPYVLEEFRFHMTLAGPVPLACIDAYCERLAGHYAPCDEAVAIDEIAVFRQTSRDQRFHVLARFALAP